MRSFRDIFDQYNWYEEKESICSKTATDVEKALSRSHRDLEDFKALISPAARPYLEQMAQLSHSLTQKRFGKTIQLYIPLYLSNECQNICTYCGFSADNEIARTTLEDAQIMKEISLIKSMGFDHILLVTGESYSKAGLDYFRHVYELFRPHFSHIAMEVQPLEQAEYEELISYGLNTVLIYQETYNKDRYLNYHPKGRKSNFYHRLETPDRLGRAGIHKIGIGSLIGLEDWRTDSFFVMLHLDYLEKTYWRTKYSISFPRLRPCTGDFQIKSAMTDHELVQMICAYRIFNEEAELSLSTRESASLRDNVIKLGVTTLSAGSKTNPGGYSNGDNALEQFEISDNRSPGEIADMISSQGYEPVWKDWDTVYG